MTTSRRTALAILGLAPTAAIGSETFNKTADRPGDVQSCVEAYDKERYAAAFRKIADDIRAGHIDISHLSLNSEINADLIADVHELKLKFRYNVDMG